MAKFTEVLKILFPESQIVDSAKERGFIARKQQQNNYVQASGQTYSNSSVQQQSASVTPPQTIQPVANSAAISGGVERSVSRDAYTPTKIDEKNNIKANNVFEDLPELLKNYWVGSEKDRISLSKAFQRPFVMGFDNRKPKNAILIIGSDSRGKAYAIRCIGALLKQKKVFRYAEVSKLDFMDYASDGSNGLFLSDLYKALNTNTEATIFENIENASLGQLDIIYQLLTEGLYKLSKRYMVNKGGLIEATGVLNTELVSEISSNGKFFVLTSKESEGKVVSQLGNKFVKEIGDIITLDPIVDNQIHDLSYTLLLDFVRRCKNNLHIEFNVDEMLVQEIGTHFKANLGVRGLKEYIEDQLYAPISEIKLQGRLTDGAKGRITCDEGYKIVLESGEGYTLSDFLKSYNAMELEEARKELDQVIGLAKVKEYVLNLENNYKAQKIREGKGLKTTDISMHMIFVGNPGTGKTTIARIVAHYLKAIGVLSSGHLCEATRADLVGQYAGHTAIKTTDVINSALGGVLFIDEAYSLCRDKHDAFGLEAIDALVKGIEDHRDDLVVILAGYEDEMQEFLKANTGLKSRFPNVVHFED